MSEDFAWIPYVGALGWGAKSRRGDVRFYDGPFRWGHCCDGFGFSLHSDTWVMMNAFAIGQMRIAEVD